MKRSRNFRPLTIGLIGASAFALAACKEETEQATAYPDLSACLADASRGSAPVTEEQCRVAYAQALQTVNDSGPKYDALAACEEQHGVGNCQQAENPGGGMGSMFMPLLTGFLLGKMMGGGMMSQPLTPTKNGTFTTPGGTQFNNNRGVATVPTSTFTNKSTAGWNSAQSAARSTGGFGSTMKSTGGVGG
ncbi:DUF1190 domain-containing protein [Paenirhodobacter populi]|uniref:DUF1190 domain-containing protein n=1 Tax=Paenirhodobacter populi TaxID=2306993 RepID=UPI000FE37A46|nr:DUF1190 domain-containing protein [Sinirhodobacter populi]RWR06841.1 DUF1190 domain-containing protein [Sinirhodobacter populi]RWR07424.1 DUF1190 domain-containing protein [Sinirhodobacter populi]